MSKRFWLWLVALTGLRVFMTWDVGVYPTEGLHDSTLYVSRAYHLIIDGTFGSYDSKLMLKVPGFSYLIYLGHLLFLSFPTFNLLLLFSSALAFVLALRIFNLTERTRILVYAFLIMNPSSWESGFQAMRDRPAVSLFVFLLAGLIEIWNRLKANKNPIPWILLVCALMAFMRIFREEDRTLGWVLLIFTSLATWRVALSPKWGAALFAAGVLAFTAVDGLARMHLQKQYGVGLLHDLGEGEYPQLIAVLRSIETSKIQRHVMMSQETWKKAWEVSPTLRPAIERLPSPSTLSFSCSRFGVCDEWTSGWSVFWLKDAAFEAGLTPTAQEAQEFFRESRLEIEHACQGGSLKCRPQGKGLLRPLEFRWMDAFLEESAIVWRQTLWPRFTLPVETPTDPKLLSMFRTTLRSEPRELSSDMVLVRAIFTQIFKIVAFFLLFVGWTLIVRNWASSGKAWFYFTSMIFLYCGIRNWAIAYAAITMGFVDDRLFISVYTVLVAVALVGVLELKRMRES